MTYTVSVVATIVTTAEVEAGNHFDAEIKAIDLIQEKLQDNRFRKVYVVHSQTLEAK